MESVNYNYLIDKDKSQFPCDYCIDNRRDPDSYSKRLYDDILEAFFSKSTSAENLEQQFRNKPRFYTIKLENDTLLSSDYIGPSVYWARETGICDDIIRNFLKECRTIGGHIVWERGKDVKYKVNTARGGCYGVYDRIDWTLQLLKIFLSDITQDVNTFIRQSNLHIPAKFKNTRNVNGKFENLYNAFICSEWLKTYTFDSFCNQFNLCNSFVDENYEIIEMAPLFPFLPKDYNQYIINVCKAVNKRNTSIIVNH